MSPIASRLFLFLDEWLYLVGALVLLRWAVQFWRACERRLPWRSNPYAWAFAAWLVVGAVMVYGIAYPMHFRITGEKLPW